MEEMLKKFYAEYSDRYAKYVDASETLDVALKHPELFDEASRLEWRLSTTRHFSEIQELRKVAKIFGIPSENLEDLENEARDNL